MPVLFIRFLMAFELFFSGIFPSSVKKPDSADWCQCVVFVLNLMGIEQIPGDYWTAASLAEPDKTGFSWMEYQGFTRRPVEEIPLPGDLLVLAGGAEVVTVQIWDGTQHLVPVLVDVWAGHIGIVEDAQKVEKEGKPYLQITLLSANWGVNAKPAGVVGSCYNVDESIFLLPDRYTKARFFYASDPLKMRERIVNRANRWSLFGIEHNPQANMDGYPLTPDGFISAALIESGVHPLKPDLISRDADLNEFSGISAQPGDVIIFKDENGTNGYGIIAAGEAALPTRRQRAVQVISMWKNGRVIGPETWNLIRRDNKWMRVFSDSSTTSVRFYRYNKLQGYPIFGEKGITWVNDRPLHASISFTLTNAGGKDIEITDLYMQAQSKKSSGQANQIVMKFPKIPKISLQAGELFIYSYSIYFPSTGEYELEVLYNWQNKPARVEKAASIQVD